LKKLYRLILKSFTAIDVYVILSLLALIILSIIFFNKTREALGIIFLNSSIIFVILFMNAKYDPSMKYLRILKNFKILVFIPLIFIIYSQVHEFLPIINSKLYDTEFNKIDIYIFGNSPAYLLSKYIHPILTEYLQICYFLFFILPFSFAFELYLSKNENLYNFLQIIFFSFLVSYFLYYLFPAIGPRFTLYNFSEAESSLPGLYLTDTIRSIINVGGGINQKNISPSLIVNRDCMPSGHTWITLVNVYFVFKYHSKFRYLIFIISISLIFATIYLRYHYFIDLIMGSVFAILTILLEPIISNNLNKWNKNENCFN